MNPVGATVRNHADVYKNPDISQPVFNQLTRHIRSVDVPCMELYRNYCPDGFKITGWGKGGGRILERIKPNLKNQNGDGGLRSLKKFIGSINNLFISTPSDVDQKKELIEKNLLAIEYNSSLKRNVLRISTDKANGIFQAGLHYESKKGRDATQRFRVNVDEMKSSAVFYQIREKSGRPILSLHYQGKRGLIASVPDNQGGYLNHLIGERNPRRVCNEEWANIKVRALWKDYPQIQVTVNKEPVLDYISPYKINGTKLLSQLGVYTPVDINGDVALLFDKINYHHRKLKSD